MRIAGGRKQQPPGYHFSTADYDQFHVILVTSGEVELLVHKSAVTLRPGSGCLLPAGAAFSLRCDPAGAGYQGVFAIYTDIDEVALRTAVGDVWSGPARALRSSPELRQLGDLILAEAQQPGRRSPELFMHLCIAFLHYGVRLALAAAAEEDPGAATAEFWVERAMQVIEKNVYASQFVADALRDVGLSYRQLCRHFQLVKGMTPKHYQLRCRIQEAKRLLAGTHQPITAIALELGFSSSQHFATAFHRLERVTPSAYRRRRTVEEP